ncbi:hypothetical protein Hanom_Chr01g00006161 [Helianthus anomalus]
MARLKQSALGLRREPLMTTELHATEQTIEGKICFSSKKIYNRILLFSVSYSYHRKSNQSLDSFTKSLFPYIRCPFHYRFIHITNPIASFLSSNFSLQFIIKFNCDFVSNKSSNVVFGWY